MAGLKAAPDAPKIGVGMLGYAFMGKAHSNAFKKIPYMIPLKTDTKRPLFVMPSPNLHAPNGK